MGSSAAEGRRVGVSTLITFPHTTRLGKHVRHPGRRRTGLGGGIGEEPKLCNLGQSPDLGHLAGKTHLHEY